MSLVPGQRLSNGPRATYEVVAPAWECASHYFFRAKKVFWNYRDQDRSLFEAGPDEWLNVMIRCPRLDTGADAAGGVPSPRAAFDRELDILGRLTEAPWLLEPIDVLELPPERSSAAAIAPGVPLLVVAGPPGQPLRDGPADPGSAAALASLLREVLGMLAALHHAGLVAGVFEPTDFVHDPGGSWAFLATDRIAESASPVARRDDLFHWAALVERALLGPPAEPGREGSPEERLTPLRDALPGPAQEPVDWLISRLEGCRGAGEGLTSAADLLGDWRPARGRAGLLGRAFAAYARWGRPREARRPST